MIIVGNKKWDKVMENQDCKCFVCVLASFIELALITSAERRINIQ